MSGDKEESTGNKRREITISLGPLKLTFRGYDVLLTLVALAVVGIGVFSYMSNETVASEHKSIVENQKKQEETLSEMVYVLSLDEQKKRELKMEMPESLRKKLRNSN